MPTRWLSLLVLAAACGHAAPPAPRAAAAAPVAPAAPPAPTTLAPWSEATFAANVRVELARHFPGATVEPIGDDLLRVAPKTGDKLEVSFAKAHAQCRDDWAECESFVERTLAAMDEIGHAGAPTAAQLRVVLRASDKVALVRARARAKVSARPFSSDAQWLLAIDMPNTIGLAVDPHELGLSDADAWRIATANVKPANVVTRAMQHFVIYQDDYAPSALLFPELLVAAAHAALPGRTGHLLVACPEENIVLYTIGGAVDAASLHEAAAAGAQHSVAPLSAHVMEWTGAAWIEAL